MGRVGGVLATLFCLVAVWAGADALEAHKRNKRAQAVTVRGARAAGSIASKPAKLWAIAPPLVSDRTSYPLALSGFDMRRGLKLQLGDQLLETHYVDPTHLTARLPAGTNFPAGRPARTLKAKLVDPEGGPVEGGASMVVINDGAYPVPASMALSPDGEQVFIASATTDSLWVVDATGSGGVRQQTVGDGPVALATYELSGESWLAVLHADGGDVWLMRLPELKPIRRLALGPRPWSAKGAAAMHVDARNDTLWVSVPARDLVARFSLSTGKPLGTTRVGKRPGPLSGLGDGVVVGEGPMGGVSVIDGAGVVTASVVPGPGVPIVGGPTADFAPYVMGGSFVRDIVYSARAGVAFVSSVGPNIGPNPQRMEVSMSGGIAVIDPASGRYLRHVALPHGIPQGLALDDAAGLLYAADVATGRIYALEVQALLDDRRALTATVATLELPTHNDAILLRPQAEFGKQVRSPMSLHTGPWALSLSPDGALLHVLERFTGRVTRVDVSDASKGRLRTLHSTRLADMSKLRQRRIGEIVFFTDLSDSRMSCDGCHPGGHGGGLMFTKGDPMHIYRVPTLRAIRETPPYFSPAGIPSLVKMADVVLGRNRLNLAKPTKLERWALSAYQASLAAEPNPLRGRRGELPTKVELPDGRVGNAAAGREVFEGSAYCMECHAPPAFSSDQLRATRGRLHDVGTPVALPLRSQMQDDDAYDLPPPSLLGVRDNFPLLHSGAGGVGVENERLEATHPFALRRVLQLGMQSRKHGAMHKLTLQQQDDLLAFLLCL